MRAACQQVVVGGAIYFKQRLTGGNVCQVELGGVLVAWRRIAMLADFGRQHP